MGDTADVFDNQLIRRSGRGRGESCYEKQKTADADEISDHRSRLVAPFSFHAFVKRRPKARSSRLKGSKEEGSGTGATQVRKPKSQLSIVPQLLGELS